MDLNAKKHPTTPFDKEAKMSGVGANALWAGPFNTTGYPKEPGSSSGKNGIKLRFVNNLYSPGPITAKAQGRTK